MGLLIEVYRNAGRGGDCTLDGVSSKFTTLCLVNASGPFDPDAEKYPAVIMESHVRGCLRIVPAIQLENGSYTKGLGSAMMGGNYAATSDSRFSELAEKLLGHRFYGAVPIHDRFEY